MNKENGYVTFCKCGCGNGVIFKFDNEDGELSVHLVSDNYYFKQDKGKMSFREKLRRIWHIIVGKEYCYFDILIDKNELQEFKEFVTRL